MSIKLKLEGFDDLLKEIEKAGRSIESATESAMRQSASIMQSEMISQMRDANVDPSLISNMPSFEIENDYGRITARVGYRKGAYNPDNLSTGYKVVMMNYGTPHRKKHGKIKDISDGGVIKLGFINRAKNRARPKIKKQQEEALKKILARLK